LQFKQLLMSSTLFASWTSARFTTASCSSDNDCVQPNQDGRICYYPDPNIRSTASCTSPMLKRILTTHIAAGRSSSRTSSIAYYNNPTGHTLGDANMSVHPQFLANNESDIVICTTGIVDSSHFLTHCRYALSDDDLAVSARSNVTACREIHGLDTRVVSERCCGPPRSICPTVPLLRVESRGGTVAYAVAATLIFMALRRLARNVLAKRRLESNCFRNGLAGDARRLACSV